MKHLMILRCGKASIHKFWIHHIKKIMDIAFVYYDNSDFSEDNPTYSYYVKGTKLTGVHDFVVNHKEVIEKYDYFWLFEDDLILPYQTAESIIDFIDIYKPALSSPTLNARQLFFTPNHVTITLPIFTWNGFC